MIKKNFKSVARLFKILAPPKIQFSDNEKIQRTSNQFGVA